MTVSTMRVKGTGPGTTGDFMMPETQLLSSRNSPSKCRKEEHAWNTWRKVTGKMVLKVSGR